MRLHSWLPNLYSISIRITVIRICLNAQFRFFIRNQYVLVVLQFVFIILLLLTLLLYFLLFLFVDHYFSFLLSLGQLILLNYNIPFLVFVEILVVCIMSCSVNTAYFLKLTVNEIVVDFYF